MAPKCLWPLRRSFGQTDLADYWAGQAFSPNSVDRLAGINHTITQDKISLQAVGDPSERSEQRAS